MPEEIKISALDPAPVIPTGTEVFAVVQGTTTPTTYKTTIDSLKPALVDNLSTGAPTWTTDGVLTAGDDIIAGGNDNGSIALTLNDGYGAANLTFNHTGGIPDRSTSSARISSSVDSNQELLDFQLKGSVTAGSSTALTSVLKLYDDKIQLLKPTKCLTPTQDDHVARKDYVDGLVSNKATEASVTAVNLSLTNHIDEGHPTIHAALNHTHTIGNITSLGTSLDSKINKTAINTSHFTFADNILSLNTIQEGQIAESAVTTGKIKNYSITAEKLKGTAGIAQGDFLIYDAATGGFETTASTAQTHKLFSPNHTDVASNVTPSYGDSMYYNGTEWTTGNFGNYGADMEYMPISGSNATFTNLTWTGINGAHVKSHYDRYFSLPAGGRISELDAQSTPQSGVFNPAIVNDTVQGQTSGNNDDYDDDMYVTSRVGFGSWWNAYGVDDNTHIIAGSIQFPLADLTGTGLVNGNIRGLFIRVHNWFHAGNSIRQAKLYITYPDGSKKPLSEFQRKIADGGSVYSDLNQVVLVPVNEGQTQIEIDFELNRDTSEGVEFEIVGAQCTKRVALSPDMDVIHIAGSQDLEDQAQGYVDADTNHFATLSGNDTNSGIWTSEDPETTTATTWEHVFPITVPDNVSKTIIRGTNNWVYNSGSTEEIDIFTITIDWNAGTINGVLNCNYENSTYGYINSNDLVGEKTFTMLEDDVISCLAKFEIIGRDIVKLPCPKHIHDAVGSIYYNMAQTYTIENYKTSATSTYKPYDSSFGMFFDPPNHQSYSTFFGSSYISKDGSFIFSGGGGTYKLNGSSPTKLDSYTRIQLPLEVGEKVVEYYYSGSNYVTAFLLTDQGNVFGAGYGGTGQLGQGNLSDEPTFTKIISDVAFLSVGNGDTHYVHCLAIKNDGTAWSWGNNRSNELGRGTPADYQSTVNQSPGQIPGFGETGKIAKKAFAFNSVNEGKSFIITEDRKIWACGSAYDGGLGLAAETATFTDTGRVGDYMTANSTDANKSVFIVDGTDLWAAGDNAYGQLGLGNTAANKADKYFFELVPNISVAQISVSGTNCSTAVVETDGSLKTWGYNANGQLGLGDKTQRGTPEDSGLGNDIKKVKLFGPDSYNAIYVLKNDGTVWVSGYNGYGQLGLGDKTARDAFTKMAKDDNIFIKDFQLFGYNSQNAFVGADQYDNLWGCGQNADSDYRMLSTTKGIALDRPTLTQIDPASHVVESTVTEYVDGFTSAAANGYTQLPGGIIMQWGTLTPSSRLTHVTLPLPFPNACLNVQVSIGEDFTDSTYQDNSLIWGGYPNATDPQSKITIMSNLRLANVTYRKIFWTATGH